MPLTFTSKLTILSLPPLLCGCVVLLGRLTCEGLPQPLVEPVYAVHWWILGLSIVYFASALFAWRYAGHFGLSAGRMLFWGLVAFVCLSNGIDLLTEHRHEMSAVFAQAEAMDRLLVTSLRCRLAGWASLVILSVVALAIGFEPTQDEP